MSSNLRSPRGSYPLQDVVCDPKHDSASATVEALNIASAEQKTKGHGPLREAL